MYRIGFIDDDLDSYEDYRVRLARKDIELLYPDGITEMPEMIEWILSNGIKCFIVDYKLNNKYKFLGTELIAYINAKVPDLPCLILTNYPEESIRENLVIINLIEDRNVLAANDIEEFVKKSNRLLMFLKIGYINIISTMRNYSTQRKMVLYQQ